MIPITTIEQQRKLNKVKDVLYHQAYRMELIELIEMLQTNTIEEFNNLNLEIDGKK